MIITMINIQLKGVLKAFLEGFILAWVSLISAFPSVWGSIAACEGGYRI